MNLYLISQSVNSGEDTYDSAVVAAPDEDTARELDPSSNGKPMDWIDGCDEWCSTPSQVAVLLLGTLDPKQDDGKPQVICASFNAG